MRFNYLPNYIKIVFFLVLLKARVDSILFGYWFSHIYALKCISCVLNSLLQKKI